MPREALVLPHLDRRGRRGRCAPVSGWRSPRRQGGRRGSALLCRASERGPSRPVPLGVPTPAPSRWLRPFPPPPRPGTPQLAGAPLRSGDPGDSRLSGSFLCLSTVFPLQESLAQGPRPVSSGGNTHLQPTPFVVQICAFAQDFGGAARPPYPGEATEEKEALNAAARAGGCTPCYGF